MLILSFLSIVNRKMFEVAVILFLSLFQVGESIGRHNPGQVASIPTVESTNLRTESTSSQTVMMQGYFENVYYNAQSCKKQTNQNWSFKLNYCGPAFAAPNTYFMATVQAVPEWNTYNENYVYYSDSTCTTVASTPTAIVQQEGIVLCATYMNGAVQSKMVHAVPQPQVQSTNYLDYTMAIYDSSGNCATNTFTGMSDIQYGAFGMCLGYNGFDFMVSSCDSDGLYGQSFTTSDFTCGGAGTAVTIATSDVCTNANQNIVGWYSGYMNIVCAPGKR
jgi:hypothetical protein